jgi:hypothetical protein
VPAAGKNIVKIEYKYVLEKENEAHTIDTVCVSVESGRPPSIHM